MQKTKLLWTGYFSNVSVFRGKNHPEGRWGTVCVSPPLTCGARFTHLPAHCSYLHHRHFKYLQMGKLQEAVSACLPSTFFLRNALKSSSTPKACWIQWPCWACRFAFASWLISSFAGTCTKSGLLSHNQRTPAVSPAARGACGRCWRKCFCTVSSSWLGWPQGHPGVTFFTINSYRKHAWRMQGVTGQLEGQETLTPAACMTTISLPSFTLLTQEQLVFRGNMQVFVFNLWCVWSKQINKTSLA